MKMPQDFHALRCFSCQTFQVHIVKSSSNKWRCKVCNEKQSVKKVYGQGSSKDCRLHVQKLNALRGQISAQAEENLMPSSRLGDLAVEERGEGSRSAIPVIDANRSKWAEFLPEPEQIPPEAEDDDLVFNNSGRRLSERKCNGKKRKKCPPVGMESAGRKGSSDMGNFEPSRQYETTTNIKKSSKWDNFLVEDPEDTTLTAKVNADASKQNTGPIGKRLKCDVDEVKPATRTSSVDVKERSSKWDVFLTSKRDDASSLFDHHGENFDPSELDQIFDLDI